MMYNKVMYTNVTVHVYIDGIDDMTVFNRQKWFFPFPNPFSIYLFSKVWCVGSPPPCVCVSVV